MKKIKKYLKVKITNSSKENIVNQKKSELVKLNANTKRNNDFTTKLQVKKYDKLKNLNKNLSEKFKLKKNFKFKINKKMNLDNQKVILKNINIFLKQGYSINECIMYLNISRKDYIYNKFLEGELFSNILNALGFDKDILLIIEISENGGELSLGIDKAYNMLVRKTQNKDSVLEKLKYPILLLIFLMLALLFISNFLLPMFLKVYANFGIEVNGSFLFFINILMNLPKILLAIFVIVLIIIIYYKIQEESDKVKLLLKNKFIKKQYYKNYNNIFLTNLYSLLNLGISLEEIFLILLNQDYNFFLRYESKKIYSKLNKGEDLADILRSRKIYNENIIIAIEKGMQSNTLLEALNNIMLLEQLKTKERFEKVVMLIQPLIYLIFGLTIVLLYLSIFIPMFKIMDSL